MMTQRNHDSADFTARVALEALKGPHTGHALAGTYGVQPTQIAPWTKPLQREVPRIFSLRRHQRAQDQEALQAP